VLNKIIQGILLSLACMPVALLAQAEETIGVAFVIEKQEIDLDFAGSTRETDFDSLQLHWYTGLMSHLDGSFVLGFIDTSQSSNPFPEGQNTSGNFLEVGLRAYYYRGEKFNLSSGFYYRYVDTSHSGASQDINWRWHHGSVDVRAQIQLGNYLELLAGASAIFIDGEERASGTVTQLIDFKEKDSLSEYAGAQIILDRTGRIGIKIDTGSLRGGQIYFARWF
jgi:hypothetical protein